jgi:hypothetical protein
MTAKSRHRERYEPGFMLMDLHRGGIPAIMRKYELQALYRGALWEVDDDTVGDTCSQLSWVIVRAFHITQRRMNFDAHLRNVEAFDSVLATTHRANFEQTRSMLQA